MKLSLDWLCEFIPTLTSKDPAALMHELTMAGIEVESISRVDKDTILELSITPNRGDCLSIFGLAREWAAIHGLTLQWPNNKDTLPPEQHRSFLPIEIEDINACPNYLGCLIDLSGMPATPAWIVERLEKSDVKPINLVVDVTNYVMFEYGQPMHAFDADQLTAHKKIIVRKAKDGERLTLLNQQEVSLTKNTLLITGIDTPLALAGIMGGIDTSVTDETRRIFLESAYFSPDAVANVARTYALSTDSAYRFERGVDPSRQLEAIQRVLQLLNQCGVLNAYSLQASNAATIAPLKTILLREKRVMQLIGADIPVAEILKKLSPHLDYAAETAGTWQITVKPHRHDLTIEADIIEEIARIYGYDHIKPLPMTGELVVQYDNHEPNNAIFIDSCSEKVVTLTQLRHVLVDRGYHEAVNYSFIDPASANLFVHESEMITLKNPIAPELSVMRPSLLPGLLKAAVYNLHRQQHRGKLFETGLCFAKENQQVYQAPWLAGVAWGLAEEEQWGIKKRPVDFFDVKGDVSALLALTHQTFEWLPLESGALFHPGQSAQILHQGHVIGRIGKLHPDQAKLLDISTNHLVVFELNIPAISQAKLPEFATLSKYPEIRRDFAFLVDVDISAAHILQVFGTVAQPEQGWIINKQIFDVYQDSPQAEKKSIAVSLVLQHQTRTLQDDEVNQYCQTVLEALNRVGAQLRG